MSHISTKIKELLQQADEFAVENVQAGRGGPFGAITAIINKYTGETVLPATLRANAVLSTGMASAHAEDQALQPDDLRALVLALQAWNSEPKGIPTVIFASSGQSCQSCLAKEEIVVRWLIGKNLIKEEDFIVAYGATFQQTAEVAGFNDLPYILDLIRYDQDPYSSKSMVKHSTSGLDKIPENVRKLFQDAARPITVIARGNKILSVGSDQRGEFDPISTAEVVAIRNACADQKAKGMQEPWVLGDKNYLNPDPEKIATLYTATPDIGPLMRGEAQWAAVNRIVSVRGLQTDRTPWETIETPHLPNRDFLYSLAQGYNNTLDVEIVTVHDSFFANKAQYEWAAKLKREGNGILYNGMTGDDADLERFVGRFERTFKGMSLDHV